MAETCLLIIPVVVIIFGLVLWFTSGSNWKLGKKVRIRLEQLMKLHPDWTLAEVRWFTINKTPPNLYRVYVQVHHKTSYRWTNDWIEVTEQGEIIYCSMFDRMKEIDKEIKKDKKKVNKQ